MKLIPVMILIIILSLFFSGCTSTIDYRQEMRNFVQNISAYTKEKDANFIIITQNGVELITDNGESIGDLVTSYISAIDGVGQESVFYGYDNDNEKTPDDVTHYLISYLTLLKDQNKKIMVTDYCWTRSYIDSSYQNNEEYGFISFAANHRELDSVPIYPKEPYKMNNGSIDELKDAKNFLYLINPHEVNTKEIYLQALQETSYDILIIDLFFNKQLTEENVTSLKLKENGGSRLVLAYMSIGEAEDYRYYWKDEWNSNRPDWLDEENPNWPGNYKVKYWYDEWQNIIYKNNDSYLNRIIDAGFDGVYLDIIDAYEYYE